MKALKDYELSFSGLSEGRHEFRYRLEDAFFACFPEGEIREADVTVFLTLERAERLMRLRFDFQGSFKTGCDRCLSEIDCPVSFQDEVVVRFTSEADAPDASAKTGPKGANAKQDEDHLWWVEEHRDKLDLSQYLYEMVALQRPIQWFCPEDENGQSTCNAAMMAHMGTPQQEPQGGGLSEDNLARLRALKQDV